MDTIRMQTGYVFYYTQPPVDPQRRVTIRASHEELKPVLERVFARTDIAFEIREGKIYLTKKKTEAASSRQHYRGVVLDAKHQLIVGASVIVRGTTTGVSSDIEGRFELEAPTGASLEISYLGYQSRTVELSARTELEIVLQEDNTHLEDVVVIGYGTMKKKDLTGAVSSIKMSDEPVGTVSSISHALAGKAAGLQVNLTSAQPGAATTLRIRGAASVQASNDPLVIIDGFPVSPMGDLSTSDLSTSSISDNVLGSLNPNDIESIDVLKDASSTAIYGSRAANGVILITTKQGKSGAPKVTYSGTASVQFFAKKFEMLDARDFMRQTNRYLRELYLMENGIGVYGSNLESDAPRAFEPRYTDAEILFPPRDTDWFDEITRNGFQTQHNVSLNGGTDFTKYFVSFNYFRQNGLVRRNDISRYTGRVNLEQKVKEWLRLGVNLTLSRNLSHGGGNSLTSAARFNPLIAIKDPDGNWAVNPLTSYLDNPVAILDVSDDSTKDRLLSTAFAEFTPIRDLTLKAQVGIDRQAQKRGTYSPNSLGPSSNGTASIAQGDKSDYLLDLTANYVKKWNRHSLNLMGGYSFQRFTQETVLAGSSDFLTDAFLYNNLWAGAVTRPTVGSGAFKREMASFFGRANYNYDDRYLLTVTFRADGSSVFAANHRWGYFPSAAVAWRFTEERFMEGAKPVLSYGKLRLSYGQTGNASAMEGAISYYKTGFEHVFGNQKYPGVYLAQIGNPDLKWETTAEWNFGLDLGFFDDRLNVTVEYFDREISDLLDSRALQSYNEVTSIAANIGKTQSRGLELTVGARIFQREHFSWTSDLTFSFYRDRWKERSDTWKPNVYEEYDAPIRAIYSYVSDGLIQPGDDISHMPGAILGQVKIKDLDSYLYDEAGAIVTDASGKPMRSGVPDGKIDEADMVLLGSEDPDYLMGFNHTLRWRNFDLNIYFYGQFGLWNSGSYKRTWLSSGADIDRGYNMPVSLKDTWSHDNLDAAYPTMLQGSTVYGSGDYFWNRIWFIRCRNITLGYTLPRKLLRGWASNLRIYAEVSNPFVLTPYDGLDPETDTASTVYPNVRGLNFGVDITF